MRPITPWILLSVVAAAYPFAASAQSAPEDASDLLRSGSELRRDGRHEDAMEAFRRAVEAERSGHALAELGFTERSLGRWMDAETHLAEALLLEEERWIRHHRREVQDALSEVRSNIGRVRVTSNVDGAEVRINGAVAGRTPMSEPVRVGVGRAAVELRLAGYATGTRTVSVTSVDDAEAHVPLDRSGPPPQAEAPPPPQCPPGLTLRNGLCFEPPPPPVTGVTAPRVMLYGGAGLTVLTAAIALGVWAGGNGDESDYLAACGGQRVPASCMERWRTTQASLDDRAGTVHALWVVSTLALATTVTGLLLELRPWQRRTYTDGSRFTVGPTGLRVRW